VARLFAIMVSIGIVGMLQGLIIPLLALLLERRGVDALVNGISTTAVFLGVILASPFIERVVRRYGAKRTILYSNAFCILMTVLFPLLDNLYIWVLLRLLLGVGLAGLFVATEIWLNHMLTAKNRGRVFSFYGLAIALGMMAGPQGMHLLQISEGAPFFVAAGLFLIPLWLTSRVSEEGSHLDPPVEGQDSGLKRWWRIFAVAPFAMGASFVYGYLDGALVGDFPIFGARNGLTNSEISFAMSLFVFGSICFQFPLGWLSDSWGRRPALILASLTGLAGFLLLPFVAHMEAALLTVFFFIGGALGSFYSLGLASLGDTMRSGDLPTANVLYTMLYGVGSLLGPAITGGLIFGIGKNGFAWSVAAMLVCYAVSGLISALRTSKTRSSVLSKSDQGV